MNETTVARRTVQDALYDTDQWRNRVENLRHQYGDGWYHSAISQVDQRERTLHRFPPDMFLLSFGEAQATDLLSDEEKFVLRWQHARSNLTAPSHSELALYECLIRFDDERLTLLARGFPVEVRAYRQWREGSGFAQRLRSMPLDFDI